MTPPLEHDYIGIGLPSAAASSTPTTNATNALKTDLRLGLPGSESPERAANGVTGLTLVLTPRAAAGSKRGFSDSSSKWVFGGSEPKPKTKVDEDNNKLQLQPNNNPVPAAKAQVVGWPPVRNYRKNTMASNSNTNPSLKKKKEEEEGEGKIGSGCLYVKVSMDGAPYLRKVDLKMYSNYKDLSLALQKMFSCFTIGQCGSHRMAARDGQGESRLADHGSENVLTYEDKDGDWMLVGDVPWDMFTETCRRLRIMKGSDAIGLAPRATGKSKNQN